MTQFEAVAHYAGRRVKIVTDTFAELHQALAGIEELNRDARYLQEQGIEDIVPVYRKDSDENEYYGFQDRYSRRNITFGKKREKGIIPFFPKGAEGYYDPSEAPRRTQDDRERTRRPQQSPRQQGERQRTSVPPEELPY